ncbi:hypothetical protein [uncultured Methanospirillum sp.]|uniref:hypothetical protein n=1 Tax=uncultured Methanospirillum sp. TaxID=262503 RepID=UPI0029C85E50|nr:hypothetical protein [uncultured Methanospirillum sp.]
MHDQFPTAFPRDSRLAFDLIDEWYDDFTKSLEYQQLDEEDNEYAHEVVTDLAVFLLYYQDCLPSEWTKNTVERCLMVDFPRSLYRDGEYIYSVPGVLTQFFRYLHRLKRLSKANAIAKGIETLKNDFYEVMDNPDLYSMRKSLLIGAEDEGVDTDDFEEVLKYFQKVGERMMEGVDPNVTNTLYSILSTWVLPFSDSRYVSDLNQVSGTDVIDVLSTMVGLLVQEISNPNEWNVSDVCKSIENTLIPCPMDPKTKNSLSQLLMPFLHFLEKKICNPMHWRLLRPSFRYRNGSCHHHLISME